MVNVFITNKDGIIELTEEKLRQLLNEAYEDGKRDAHTTYVPYITSKPTPRGDIDIIYTDRTTVSC